MSVFDVEDGVFNVVVNEAGQVSIWPADRAVPSGWRVLGAPATKHACLAAIEARGTASGSQLRQRGGHSASPDVPVGR
jgi:MbtH protein